MHEIVEELTAGDTILPAPERETYPRTTLCAFDAVTGPDGIDDEGPDAHGGYRQTERYRSGPARRCTAPSCRCESPCDEYCAGRWGR